MKHISAFFDPKEKWRRRFAWLPTRSTKSSRIIWLQWYWQVDIYMDAQGKVPIRDLTWRRRLTDNEVLLQQIRYPKE